MITTSQHSSTLIFLGILISDAGSFFFFVFGKAVDIFFFCSDDLCCHGNNAVLNFFSEVGNKQRPERNNTRYLSNTIITKRVCPVSSCFCLSYPVTLLTGLSVDGVFYFSQLPALSICDVWIKSLQ